MTELNVNESAFVAGADEINKEVGLQEKESIFFGNLDIPMHEIDEAIKKLEQLSLHRLTLIEDNI